MKKIIFLLTFLLLSVQCFAQLHRYETFGKTILKDSMGSGSVNWYVIQNSNVYVKDTAWVGGWLWVGHADGGIKLDTTGNALIMMTGWDMILTNLKEDGSVNIKKGWTESKHNNSNFQWSVQHFPDVYTITLDSTGIDLTSNGHIMSYKINGSDIVTGGSVNLYGYIHKDTAATLHTSRPVDFDFAGDVTLGHKDNYGVKLITNNTTRLVIDSLGNMTLGTVKGTGTGKLYAGYIRSSDTLNTRFISSTSYDTVIVTNKLKVKGGNLTLSASDNSIYLGQYAYIWNSGADLWVNGLSSRVNGDGILVGAGQVGQAFISSGYTGSLSTVNYGFFSDQNTGLSRQGADSIAFVTNGIARTLMGTTLIKDNLSRFVPALYLNEQAGLPVGLAADTQAAIYVKDNKLIIAWVDGMSGSRFYYADLSSGLDIDKFIYSATEP